LFHERLEYRVFDHCHRERLVPADLVLPIAQRQDGIGGRSVTSAGRGGEQDRLVGRWPVHFAMSRKITYQNRLVPEIIPCGRQRRRRVQGETMASARVVRLIRRFVAEDELEAVSDAHLLQRFLGRREEAAFATLVRRHGAMVWGVCRRLLRHHQDAENAFQATFVVLFRKAASIRPQSLLGNWLYGVAHQVAVKARAMNAKRMSREKQLPEPLANASAKPQRGQDWQPVLDQELSLLPHKYRAVIVLCDLEGKTRKEAAAQLEVPEGTVAGRLARARALLAKRLARHGIATSAGALAASLGQHAASAPPAAIVAATIQWAQATAAGGVLSAKALVLAEGVVRAMFLSKFKSATVFLFVLAGIIGLGLRVMPGPGGDAVVPSRVSRAGCGRIGASPPTPWRDFRSSPTPPPTYATRGGTSPRMSFRGSWPRSAKAGRSSAT
jgi:RNA polymerase sigma factor (sigma-70 family)